jgi:hypothetical protein
MRRLAVTPLQDLGYDYVSGLTSFDLSPHMIAFQSPIRNLMVAVT